MKTNIMTVSVLALGITLSCGNLQEQKHHETTTTEKVDSKNSDENAEVKLTLNNGAKWNSDESTFNGMGRLEATLAEFSASTSTSSITDYNSLGESLANINKEIISQCSMKGEDHDQLHIILAPMLANVDVIKNGEDIDKAKTNTDELSKAIDQFFAHFEVK